jgi:DNA-binding winged helix-turn-helix (wHTH) protein/predicted ATPase
VLNEHRIQFDPFALDLANACLWRGSQAIKLRPRAFAVLEYLLGRPGQLVTKQNLISAVWQDTFVGDAVLKVAIREIREALADDPKAPRFIETAHRRGYRFIGQIGTSAALTTGDPTLSGPASPPLPRQLDIPGGFVGRAVALSRMHGWLERVLGGERQVVFVTGEAGIGKTTLLDTFARSVAADRSLRICSGQCLEQYGTSEAYLPVLEAMRELCRAEPQVVGVLRAHAPMWLLQMPSLVTPADRESLGREVLGGTRERMLREMSEALDVLTADAPLVLLLEDLHWSDYSTLDLISYLARQRRTARLMVVGTYRPAELIVSGHPLRAVKQELLAKQQCEELSLEYLNEDAVAQYLAARFPANRLPTEVALLIHERTEGNPLFMVNTIDYLVTERLIEEHDNSWQMTAAIDTVKFVVPESIRHLIEKQMAHLDDRDQRILEAASVAGAEFSAPGLAAGLGEGVAEVEQRCEALSRRGPFIRDAGVHVLPAGDVVGRYGFVHAVYRNVLYERLSASRRILLHRRFGERGEELYRGDTSEIAGELAMHFERAANYQRAARYLQQAADNAMRRSAYREAVALSRRGLELLAKLPDTPDRARQELWLQITLGVPLIASEGYAAPDVGAVYLKARTLCQRLGDTPEISQVLWGLWVFHVLKAELSTALEIARELLQLAERLPYPGIGLRGHWAMEITFTHRGEFALAVEHFDHAISLYEPAQHRDDAFLYALNPGVALRCFAAWSRWFLGWPDRALALMQEAVALARDLAEPHGLAHALLFAAILHQLRRERPMAQEHADAAIALSSEHGLVLYKAMATIIKGWALVGRRVEEGPDTQSDDQSDEEPIRQMRQGIAAWQTTGAQLMRPHFLALLAEKLEPSSPDDEGLRLLDDALASAESTGERWYEAELYRLRGERLLARARHDPPAGGMSESETQASTRAAAETCFTQSLTIARRQQAQSLELRAAMSLARLWRGRGTPDTGSDLVASILGRFREGFDTLDVREARGLLAR